MGKLISDKYKQWEQECESRFRKLKSNEEELNHIFIHGYGLQNELTSEVEDKDITVQRADLQREIKSLISYAVGCLFGRYSVDCEGLCYAGGEWDNSKYQTIIPENNSIIPICDNGCFENDMTVQFVNFISKVYGKETLEENLKFISDILGGKGTSREVISNYFLTGFYSDHCRIYRKRPIYWMFSSGKKHAFKALVYMHRWRADTVATVHMDYVCRLQEYDGIQLQVLGNQQESAISSERAKLKKQAEKLQAQLMELDAYEKKIHYFADKMTEIDLDDGVKVNYAKFAEILQKIK